MDEHLGIEGRFELEAGRAFVKATLLVPAAHLRKLQADPSVAKHRDIIDKRLTVYGDRMPFDQVMGELLLL